VGIGDRMSHALMFIIYPSSERERVTVSVRTTSGHNTPSPISDIQYTVSSSQISNSTMIANVICHNCTKWEHGSLDLKSTKQAWIRAVGPGKPIASDAQDATIDQHSSYGIFFMDMPQAEASSATIPTISGVSNLHVQPQPSSVPALIIIHAVLLAGSFLLLFPLGVTLLRWRSLVRIHYILQLSATALCVIGLAVAIVMSVIGIEYADFDQTHQILGIAVVTALAVQALLGWWHHRTYKAMGRRTLVSWAHIWTGKTVVFVGLVDAVLGAALASETALAIGLGVVGLLIYVGMTAAAYIFTRPKRSQRGPAPYTFGADSGNSSGDVILGSLSVAHAEE